MTARKQGFDSFLCLTSDPPLNRRRLTCEILPIKLIGLLSHVRNVIFLFCLILFPSSIKVLFTKTFRPCPRIARVGGVFFFTPAPVPTTNSLFCLPPALGLSRAPKPGKHKSSVFMSPVPLTKNKNNTQRKTSSPNTNCLEPVQARVCVRGQTALFFPP